MRYKIIEKQKIRPEDFECKDSKIDFNSEYTSLDGKFSASELRRIAGAMDILKREEDDPLFTLHPM